MLVQAAHDVVDREVALTKLDDLCAKRGALIGSRLGDLPGGCSAIGQKEGALRILAKLVAQDPKAAWCVAELVGDLSGGTLVDEVGPKRLVLPVGGVRGCEEGALEECYVNTLTHEHIITLSIYEMKCKHSLRKRRLLSRNPERTAMSPSQ